MKRIRILNIPFNPATYQELISFFGNENNRTGYVCFPDLYNIIRANEDDFLKNIYENSTLTLPDGKPSQFFLKRAGIKNATTISGYWLCRELLKTNLTHFFYGTTPQNLQLMKEKIFAEFPQAKIAGFKSPPFVSENNLQLNKELEADMQYINSLKPDIIWIGLSSPKQDMLMYYYKTETKGTIMVGVGAVFDYFAGTAHMGPEWVKKMGLRWLYQLVKNPKRYYVRLLYIFQKFPFLFFKNSSEK